MQTTLTEVVRFLNPLIISHCLRPLGKAGSCQAIPRWICKHGIGFGGEEPSGPTAMIGSPKI